MEKRNLARTGGCVIINFKPFHLKLCLIWSNSRNWELWSYEGLCGKGNFGSNFTCVFNFCLQLCIYNTRIISLRLKYLNVISFIDLFSAQQICITTTGCLYWEWQSGRNSPGILNRGVNPVCLNQSASLEETRVSTVRFNLKAILFLLVLSSYFVYSCDCVYFPLLFCSRSSHHTAIRRYYRSLLRKTWDAWNKVCVCPVY